MIQRNTKVLLLLIFCFGLIFAQGKVVAAVSSLKGNVMVKPVGSRKYVPAYKGQMLKNGDWVKTATKVFVAIVFLDGSNIKIQQETEVKITSYRMTAKELRTNLDLARGQAFSNVASQGSAGEFMITTPTAVASVKGTEFDLEYDIEDQTTTLMVITGEVEFANELGTILAGAMTSAKATANEQIAEPEKITEEETPQWQKKTDPEYSFKLKPDKVGRQAVNQVIKIAIEVVNAKSKKLDSSYSGEIVVNSESSDLVVSANGSSWGSSATINMNGGKGTAQINSGKQGKFAYIFSMENSESQKLVADYYQSKTQKRNVQNKLASIAGKKGKSDLSSLLEGKTLKASKLKSGAGNVEDVLQKMDTGELELDEVETIDNGDGTYTVRMKIKPRE